MKARLPILALILALTHGCAHSPQPAGVTAPTQPPKLAPRPNIIVFLADDLGWQDVSVPLWSEETVRNRRYRTPNLMRLAQEGMKFTNAYAAASVCTPTRVAFITGRTPAETHITTWTEQRDKDNSGRDPMLPPDWNLNGFSPVAGVPRIFTGPMLPKLLQEAGYKTIHIGKAHWGAQGTPGADPKNLGFDVNVGGSHAGEPGNYGGQANYASPAKVRDVPHLEAYHGTETFLTEALTIEANKAVDGAVAEKRPFFLHMAHFAVHTPLRIDPRFRSNYKELVQARRVAYATMIEGLDKSLGDIMANLSRHGIADNTLVVFASDNGGVDHLEYLGPSNTNNAPLRAGKGTPYEGGLRVPMVVRWPGQVEAGSTSHAPVITDDLFPTLLRLAAVKDRDRYVAGIRGRDLQESLTGSASPQERPLVWHRPNSNGTTPTPDYEPYSAVRLGEWKLIYFYPGRRYELYNLQTDLSEKANVLAQNPEVAARLSKILNETLRNAKAQTPIAPATMTAVELPPVLPASR